jgi:hypothetical protein
MMKLILLVVLSRLRRFSLLTSDLKDLLRSRHLFEFSPIDYFDHKYYNCLQPHLRHHITNAKIALLPDISLSFSGTADEKLTDQAFNSKYGAQVLAKYNLVDEDEFDGDDEWLVDDDADMLEDDEYDDNVNENGVDEGDVLMFARQNSLTAHSHNHFECFFLKLLYAFLDLTVKHGTFDLCLQISVTM